MAVDPKTQKLRDMRTQAKQGGGQERIERQHAKGKLTARERIERLLDPDTFRELDMFVSHRTVGFGMEEQRYLSDSVVTGWGKVDGRLVYVFAQDFTVFGGTMGEMNAVK
ncbi:MAG: carboxyl transferase domain-containing protein, partial [Anaerolineae bacterium]